MESVICSKPSNMLRMAMGDTALALGGVSYTLNREVMHAFLPDLAVCEINLSGGILFARVGIDHREDCDYDTIPDYVHRDDRLKLQALNYWSKGQVDLGLEHLITAEDTISSVIRETLGGANFIPKRIKTPEARYLIDWMEPYQALCNVFESHNL